MYSLSVSKKEIGRAGERLVSQLRNGSEYLESDVQMLHEWRMLHLYPLNKIRCYLEREALILNKNSLISSRIKRLPSIVTKLSRFPEMKLNKMQDLGGCRAILDNVEQVYSLVERVRSLRFMHELVRTDDYMVNVKDSGYRSFHMIYSFKNNKYSILNGLRIEMQIRTAVQHSWATAVEMVGLFRKESLKSGLGDDRWLRFFELVSELFYSVENGKVSSSYIPISSELKNLTEELNVFDLLTAYNAAINHIEESNLYKRGLCVIVVDTNKKNIQIKNFERQNSLQAAAMYVDYEKFCAANKGCEVAMVSVNSISDLKSAYPAYFLDTKTFLNNLRRFVF